MDILKTLIGTILLSPVIWVGNIVAPHTDVYQNLKNRTDNLEQKLSSIEENDENLGGTFNFVASGRHTLSGSGISATDTSIGLTSFTKPISGLEYVFATDFGDIAYGTLEPQNATRKEFISFTGVTYNAGGSATLTGVTRGLDFDTPYTASTTLRRAHSGGTTFIISNAPQLYNELATKRAPQSITDVWTFPATNTPRYNIVPANHNTGTIVSTTSEFASTAYVNAVALSGSPDAAEGNQGVVELATQVEAASSTSSGTEARLVLPASIATSTCANAATASLRVVMTDNTGNIDSSCVDSVLDDDNTWTGANTFNTARTRLNASTTINGSTSTPLHIADLTYAFPSTAGASSSLLTTTGGASSTLSWSNAYSKKIAATSTDTTVTASASTTIVTFTLPAGSLGVDGTLHIHGNFNGWGADMARSFILALHVGGVPVAYASSTWVAVVNNATDNTGYFDIYTASGNSVTAQENTIFFKCQTPECTTAGHEMGRMQNSTFDSTVAQTIAVVAQFPVTNTQGNLVFRNSYAELIR